jgi:peptidyl-dipeptidase Dcp
LREQAFRAWAQRGENGGETDNRAIAAEIVALRAERARLLGFASFAHYRLDDAMAKTPENVRRLLDEVWAAGLLKAHEERELLEERARAEGGNFSIEAWDWRYYAEKVRSARFDLDEAALKPYLQLDRVIEGAFLTARRLFGLNFTDREDVPRYHPDVRVWEVSDEACHIGLFCGDYFGRPGKRSGAWMSSLRTQHQLGPEERPIVCNTTSFARGAPGEPTLLSFDDARTLFHEFGHALHGLLSDVTYPSLSGTAVATDFVELPSQLYEHWLLTPEILERTAVHYRTGEPMPRSTVEKLRAAQTFNQGFATVEYVASAMVDLDLHARADESAPDVSAAERETLARIGMPREIVPRHRLPHFAHLFSGGGYAAAYYSYLWSEVLDADAFEAFLEAGDVFDPPTARRLREVIYSAGNRRDPAEAYVAFRGRLPKTDALLRKRGLSGRA